MSEVILAAPGPLKAIAALGIVLVVLYCRERLRRRFGPPLPPGPPKHFLYGNLRDVPREYVYHTYEEWGETIHSSFVILNSFEAATALFQKKSSIYSSRIGWDWLLSSLPYGERWKHGRNLIHRQFNPSRAELHEPRQLRFIRGYLLPKLLENKQTIDQIARHLLGGMSLAVAYGIKIKREDDPFINLGESAVESLVKGSVPGKYLYVPKWFPGAGFQREAAQYRKLQEGLRERPWEAAIKSMGDASHTSFAASCINEIDRAQPDYDYRLEIIKDTAAVIFGAGVDTLSAATETIFLALASFPEVVRKAQAEIDRVIGPNQLPEFEDRPNLPYISAIVRESLRWQPATPIVLAVPHLNTEEDIYKGYRIPKGSIVTGNAWAMLHNEQDFPEPLAFRPERFLNPDGSLNNSVRDPCDAAFGFGRRECPGKDLALSILWLITASALTAFDFEGTVNEVRGRIVPQSVTYRSGLIRHPEPFGLIIRPRTEQMREVVMQYDRDEQL
ncbi:cytochrome P450 [Coprinopsis sp. MPI-PUGE-AT-0042]|nr:cytochrome P450 [Coprinopsis sp. MPI-PUGE-AT-0042]